MSHPMAENFLLTFDPISFKALFKCPCGQEHSLDVRTVHFQALDLTKRSTWGMRFDLPCGGNYHPNLNMPADHPHPNRPYVEAMLTALGPPPVVDPITGLRKP